MLNYAANLGSTVNTIQKCQTNSTKYASITVLKQKIWTLCKFYYSAITKNFFMALKPLFLLFCTATGQFTATTVIWWSFCNMAAFIWIFSVITCIFSAFKAFHTSSSVKLNKPKYFWVQLQFYLYFYIRVFLCRLLRLLYTTSLLPQLLLHFPKQTTMM